MGYRIFIINYEFPPLGGGAATATQYVSRELVKMGSEVLVLTSRYRDLPREEVIDGVNIIRIPVLRKQKDRCSIPEMISFMASSSWFGFKHLKRYKPDAAITFFSIPCGHVGLLGKWFFKTPYIVSLRGGDVPGFMGKELAFYHKITLPFTKIIWKNAEFVVGNSRGLVDLAQKHSKKKIRMIPNGVDTELFRPEEKSRNDKFQFLFVGRLSVQKDVPTLLRSAKNLKEEAGPGFRVSLIGGGPLKSSLEEMSQNLDIEDVVDFCGWRERREVRKAYRNSDAFILPSIDEGMPNVVLEAMASGLPVIATRIKGNVELVENGENGYLFETGDYTELTQKMKKVMKDTELRNRMKVASRSRAEKFSWQSVAYEYFQLIKQMVTKK